MNWKGRQMFGGGPSGIVQMMGGGMTPYPTHTMPNGTVMPGAVHGQGYQAGGLAGGTAPTEPSMEQRIAQIAAQQGKSVPEMKAQILQKTATDQGLQLPPEAIQQYAVGMISLQDALSQGTPAMQAGSMGAMPMQQPNAQIQMQAGGMVGAELFEEGDSDINNALNTMASVSNPEVPDMPASNGMALPSGDMGGGEMTMDQGSGYEKDVMQLKELFKNEIRSYVSQSGTTDLDTYLKQIGSAYRNKLNELKDKYGVQEYDPSEELITEDFLAELSGEPPMIGMQGAGTVFSDEDKIAQQKILTELQINIPLERWLGMDEEERTKFINIYTIMRSNSPINPTARKPLTRADLDTGSYDALTQERRENAERMGAAARAGYSSTQSRLLHHDSAKKAGEATEAMAMDKLLADQIGDERGILNYLTQANAPGRGATGKNQNLPSDVISDLYGLDPDNEVNLDKSLDTLWKEQTKKNPIGAANLDEEFLKFITQYGTFPPVYGSQYGGERRTLDGPAMFVPWIKIQLALQKEVAKTEGKEFDAVAESIKLRNEWATFPKT